MANTERLNLGYTTAASKAIDNFASPPDYAADVWLVTNRGSGVLYAWLTDSGGTLIGGKMAIAAAGQGVLKSPSACQIWLQGESTTGNADVCPIG